MSRFHLTVIAKQPVAGRVKTRLVPPLSHEQAAQIAAACLHDTFEAVSAYVDTVEDVRAVALIDGRPGSWIPDGFQVHHQRSNEQPSDEPSETRLGGLAERLANGFDDLGPGLIIGMDTPSSGSHFPAAFDALRAHEDAIGMTHDGGYWGLALCHVDVRVFEGVPMSTDGTGRAQLERLRTLGRTVRVLPTVHDLDAFDDIAPIVADLPGSNLASFAASLLSGGWG